MNDKPLDSLKSPSFTSAIIFLIDKPTKSVLLFETPEKNLGGYVFEDPSSNLIIREKAVEAFSKETGIKILDPNKYCPDVLEELTGEEDAPKSKWKFIIILQNFHIPKLPPRSKWYHVNQIRFGRIKCKLERDFLEEFMKNL